MKFKIDKNKKIIFGVGFFGFNILLIKEPKSPNKTDKKDKKKEVNFQYF